MSTSTALRSNNHAFQFVRDLVRRHSGVELESGKEWFVEARLAPLAAQAGAASVAELVASLREPAFSPLHKQVINALLTNETSFFRDHYPFEALRRFVLPQLLADGRSGQRLQFWCAGCASGQEPYSIAMLLDEHFPQLARGRARILATDISSDMVARGAAGLYSRVEVNRGLPAPLLVKYFQEEGSQWRLKAPLRAMVEFREHNLVTEDPPLPGVDILFLRNVLIYFELATKKAVLEKLKALLNPGGILFLGAAETTLNIDNGFAPVRSSRAIWYRAPRRPSGLRLIK